ncbi:MAG: hypothetical protein SAK29_19900 [Scytonema sp. PMC 1069.18]|nr:hypothetical protein [Scytonema sp. PMC 1069.18]MEC4886344.1 hypothetical protein [Scytonema sp. PMC 1070.18]
MRVWLACFFVLFALAELFDWVKEFQLPLPIYILGGAFLAVASNYDKLFGYNLSEMIAREATATLEQPQLDSSPPNHSPALKDSQKSEVER